MLESVTLVHGYGKEIATYREYKNLVSLKDVESMDGIQSYFESYTPWDYPLKNDASPTS